MRKKVLLSLWVIFILAACSTSKVSTTVSLLEPSLHLLDVYEIPFNTKFQQTAVGGLSSIDYHIEDDVYYMISDDRSAFNPARFYKAAIRIINNKMKDIRFLSADTLRRYDGSMFPSFANDPFQCPDPESLRYLSTNKQFIWANEGERLINNEITILLDPAIYISNQEGKVTDSFKIPSIFKMKAEEKGPRRNGTFESLSLNKHLNMLYACMEEPLYEDGQRAGLHDSVAWVRMIKFDIETRKPVLQYAYQVEPVVHTPKPENAFRINGVSEILYVGNKRMIVVESSWSAGQISSNIKVFLTDHSEASDVSSIKSLTAGSFKPIQKKLLVDMDKLGINIDNIEGVTFGPRLSNGNPSLVFVSDNNFNKHQVTQILLFELKNFIE
jgi:hypothetical protein